MTEELKVKVKLDTSELKNGIKQIKDTLKQTTSEFSGIEKSTKSATNNTKVVTAAMTAMGAATVAQSAAMTKAMKRTTASTKEVSLAFKKVKFDIKAYGDILKYTKMLSDEDFTPRQKLKLFSFMLRDVKKDLKEVGKAIKENIGIAFKAGMENVAKGVGVLVKGIAGLITSMTLLSSTTREFRQAMNQVNTSFIALGSNAETAKNAYQGFYRILGDVQRSTEAANLLAQITTAEKDLVTWTRIATGAMAMFPDSLPTESLIEASNETIKTAKVVGTLADALNWPADGAAKISKALKGSTEAQKIFNDSIAKGLTVEDAFNEVLAATNNETQREVILRASLNGIYAESAGLYEEMNKELIAQNEAQMRLNQAMAKLGSIAQPVQTAFTRFTATLAEALAPAIKIVCDWLVTLINWLTTAAAWLGAFLSVLFPGIADKLSSAFSGVSSSIDTATGGAGSLKEGLEEAEDTAQKLRRTLMGFDELNVVSAMNTGGSSSSSASGGGAGVGAGIDVSGLDTGDSVFKKAQDQMEEFKQKIQDFMDKWENQIKIIAGALGLMGVAHLIDQFGKLIGLGDQFHKAMSNIKKLAATAIVITLQYSFVNEFMDNFIKGQGIKEYIKGLIVAALGTGVLYAMWGPAGLMIGLGVTAVASLKAVMDNGGITNVESLVVALTGLAAAIGAVMAAVKVFNLGKVIGDIGKFFTLLKEGNGLLPSLAAAFPKLSSAVSGVGAALSGVAGSIGAIFGLSGTAAVVAGAAVIVAAITGIISVIKFLKEHWDEVGQAARNFFDQNIAPKLDGIRESFSKIGVALGPVGKVIGDIISKIGEWFKSIDWLDGIGKAFEVVGGIIFGVVSGVIAGAINALISIFEGAAQAIAGSVQIISGAIELIVNLFTLDLDGARVACEKIFNGIIDLFGGLYQAVYAPIKDFVQGVIDWFVKLWDELVGHSIVPDMINDIIECFRGLPDKVFAWIKTLVDGVVLRFTQMWNNVVTSSQNKLGELKTTIMSAWNSIKSWFSSNVASKFTVSFWTGKFNSIKDGAKAAFNGVISIVEKAVNGIIRNINKLHWEVPDWVPMFGGDEFGFDIKTINIPRLATGGITNGSTIANIGENGREAILPLENNTGWMDALADRIAARSQAPTKLVLKVGERELGWATIKGINQITKQTGELQLVL